jgi:hypothetical protein
LYSADRASCQHKEDLVLQVLLKASPSSSYGPQLLGSLHTSCSNGRAGARQAIKHVRLDRCYVQGVPLSRQLALLEAADQATALTIHFDQVEGLLHAFTPQQQPNSSRGSAAVTPGTPQTATTAPPAAKPCHRRLTHLTIQGQPTWAHLQQLEQLLDVLPGTQHLQQIVLSNEPEDAMFWGRDVTWTAQGVVWPGGEDAMAAEQGEHSAGTTAAHAAATSGAGAASSSNGAHLALARDAVAFASRGSGASWRSSCHTLLAGRGCSSPSLSAGELLPFLGSLEQLQVLYLHEVQAAYLRWDAHARLKQLLALHVDWTHPWPLYEEADVAPLTTPAGPGHHPLSVRPGDWGRLLSHGPPHQP